MQQCVYETKICDTHDLQKRLTQTWVDSEVLNRTLSRKCKLISGARPSDFWDHCARVGGRLFEHML